MLAARRCGAWRQQRDDGITDRGDQRKAVGEIIGQVLERHLNRTLSACSASSVFGGTHSIEPRMKARDDASDVSNMGQAGDDGAVVQ